MDMLFASPKRAAILSAILAAPMLILVLTAVFGIEPLQGFFQSFWTRPDGRQSELSLVLVLVFLAMMIAGLAVSVMSLIRTRNDGGAVGAGAMNLFIACAIAAFLLTLAGGIIADQLPCWMGQPNCD